MIKMGVVVTRDVVFFRGYVMNEEVVNMEIRKFIKQVGITSQREIEKALHLLMHSNIVTIMAH